MKVGTDNRIPLSACPACGHRFDGATCVGADGIPKPGDYTICIKCGHLMAFADDLTLRELTSNEMHDIAGDERVLAVQRVRGMLKRQGPKR
jgi:Zn ribbon nucleic-acid-binding protein